MELATSWPKIVYIEEKYSANDIRPFEDNCIWCYRRPSRVVHDNGTECIYREFKSIIDTYGTEPEPNNLKVPIFNTIMERLHVTMGDIPRTDNFIGLHWQEY